jgi:hypothetical protein
VCVCDVACAGRGYLTSAGDAGGERQGQEGGGAAGAAGGGKAASKVCQLESLGAQRPVT